MSPPALILVVEDEPVMRRVLTLALRSYGYEVALAANGQQATKFFRLTKPDAIILDLGLPDIDGMELLTIARSHYPVPILVLSARAEEQQQILALDRGADDYVTKPFREGELMARLRGLLRRVPSVQRDDLSIGEIQLDIYKRRIAVAGREVELTQTEFKLVHALAAAHGRVVTHERLLTEVWGPTHIDEVQYLRVHVKSIRRKIEDEPAKPKRLLTVLGIGYRLTGGGS